MTVEEMLSRISSRELTGWLALYQVEAEERAASKAGQPVMGGLA